MIITETRNKSTKVDTSEAVAAATATASFLKHEILSNIQDEEHDPIIKSDKPGVPVSASDLSILGEVFSPSPIAAPTDPNQLTETEKKLLDEYETLIAEGLKTFVQVGNALGKIRDGRLYNPPYPDFDQYLEIRWSFTKQRASQLIQAADCHVLLAGRVDVKKLPNSERAMRELIKAPEDKRAAILEIASEDGESTTESIIKARERVVPKKNHVKPKKKPVITTEEALKAAQRWVDFLTSCKVSALSEEQQKLIAEVSLKAAANFKKLNLAA